MQTNILSISNVMLGNISAPLRHFFPPCFCTALLSVFTGMVISEDWRAGLGSGASTVRTPSGEREEVIFSASAPGGSLEKTRGQPTYMSGGVFKLKKQCCCFRKIFLKLNVVKIWCKASVVQELEECYSK